MPDFGERLGRQGRGQPLDGAGQPQKTSDADWGKRETAGGRTGKLKVKSWFGLRADTKHEIPVVFDVARASRSKVKELDGDRLETPPLAGRCKEFSAGRGLGGESAKKWRSANGWGRG